MQNPRKEAPESTWAQRFLGACNAVGQKACTEVGRHPFRTVYISAVAQRGRNSHLYPFQGHFSGILSINEREGPMGLLKGAGPRVAAEGLRVLLGAPGIDATAIELDARARRRKALRKAGVAPGLLSAGNELLIESGRVLIVTAITHPLELVATRLMTEDDSMYGSFYEAVRVILEEGCPGDSWLGCFAGFYRGFQASLMLQAVELLRDRLVGNWRQQVVDTAVEWLGYVPDPAIPEVDSAGFPVPNEEWIKQRQRHGDESLLWRATKFLVGFGGVGLARISVSVCRTRLVLAHTPHETVMQALREAAPLTAQSRTELMNIGWAVVWGWLPMTLAGLVVKTIASAALNEMATDQVGEYKIVNNARAGRSTPQRGGNTSGGASIEQLGRTTDSRDLDGRANIVGTAEEAGERARTGGRERERDGGRLFYGSVSPLTPTGNHDQLHRTDSTSHHADLKRRSRRHGKAISGDVEDTSRSGSVDGVGTSVDRSDRGQLQKGLLGGSETSPGLDSRSRRRGGDSLSDRGSNGISERRRVCSTFDPVRKVSTIEQLIGTVEHARENEHLAVTLLANPSCPKCRDLVKQMSLVVVATTEQTPFENGMTDDRRRQPRVSGAVGQDTDDEGAAGNDGRQQLQPHESQLATFAHIPSAEAEGHCAHYICPITAQRMTDPVCDKDGHAYERTAILQRLANGAPVSPVSKSPLTAADLTTDHALKYAINNSHPFGSPATRLLRRQFPSLPPPPVCVFLRPRIIAPNTEELAEEPPHLAGGGGSRPGIPATAGIGGGNTALEQASMVHRVSGDVQLRALFALREQKEDPGGPTTEAVPERMLRTCERFRFHG